MKKMMHIVHFMIMWCKEQTLVELSISLAQAWDMQEQLLNEPSPSPILV